MKYVIMTTSECGRKVRIEGVPQGTDAQMIEDAKARCGKYLKLFERPVTFVVEERR